jgi:glycerol-3-phosphate acyltransferase PlsY
MLEVICIGHDLKDEQIPDGLIFSHAQILQFPLYSLSFDIVIIRWVLWEDSALSWPTTIIFAAISYLAGSVPFSLLLTKLLGKDIRRFGEGNPGVANAFRAGGMLIGIPALILDSFKGLIPVLIFTEHTSSWQTVVISIAPVLGHAFSPFLSFKGGKAITTSFGIWTGLTVWQAPTVMGLGAIIAATLLRKSSEIAKSSLLFLALGVYLLLTDKGAELWALFAANVLVVMFKQLQYAQEERRARTC